MGMIISVYRDADEHDCTNNGISSRFKRFVAVNVEGPFEPKVDMPAVILDKHYKQHLRIVPAVKDATGNWVKDTTKWYMFGGNFASTSDSRWNDAIERLCGYRHSAIDIHDRVE